jgi:hypothetical protein
MTLVYAEKNLYHRFSKFKTVEEFNNNFEQAMVFHKDKFTKGEYAALNRLRKFAYSEKNKNTIGVAWSKAESVIGETVSRSTFHRMLLKAKKLNLITVINQYKKNKYKKHNVYVFNRFTDLTPEKFEIVQEKQTNDTTEQVNFDTTRTNLLLELPLLKDLKTYSASESVNVDNNVDKKLEMKDTPYHQIRKMIEGLLPDKQAISRIYGIWLAQSSKSGIEIDFEVAKIAVKRLILEVKRRYNRELKPLKNPYGYFNGILKNLINHESDSEDLDWYKPLKHNQRTYSNRNERAVRPAPEWWAKEKERLIAENRKPEVAMNDDRKQALLKRMGLIQ